jgi:predicted nucleic acid-binding protein
LILVDSSVWIAQLRGRTTPQTVKLATAAASGPLLIGDLILLEVLQGARDDTHATRIERALRQNIVVSLMDPDLASRAARNYRRLRDVGITIRKTADIIIGTWCIERRHTLLHDDREFVPMQAYLGLKVA